MKQEFLRIISPLTAAVAFILDGASIWLAAFTIKKLSNGNIDSISVIFAIMIFFAIIISILFTKEAFSNGIIFYDDRCEFNAVDDENTVYYKDIESIEEYKDTKASFRKTITDRSSLIIFNLKNDMVHTVNIGFTTKATLKKAIAMLNEYTKKNG